MSESCARCDQQIGERGDEMAVWVTGYPVPYCVPCFEQVSGLHVHQSASDDPTMTMNIEHSDGWVDLMPPYTLISPEVWGDA